MKKRRVLFVSLGCPKNQVDGELMLAKLQNAGFENADNFERLDAVIVNTCAFIDSAKQEAIDTILEMVGLKKDGLVRAVIVTGCLAERYRDEILQEIPEVDAVVGIGANGDIDKIVDEVLDGKQTNVFPDKKELPMCGERVLTTPDYWAYLKIAEGCSNCCTFCAIPKIRGPYRSRPEADILREIESLAKQGVKEHILVAQDTSRYGMDFGGGSKLAELMQKAAKIDGVDWLRVLYCYPEETSEQLLDIIANTPNICSYVDLPIQHVNDAVLKRMHRRGTSADIRRAVKGAHDRGITLRTSIIVGFPGETEEQFQELLDFLPEAEFDRLGAFTYSPEEGTPAAKMPDQIPEEVKAERLDRLMKRQAAIARKKNQARVGTVEKVLVTDRNARGEILGRSQREAPETDGEIIFTAGESKMPSVGDFVDVRIEKASTYDLTGVIA